MPVSDLFIVEMSKTNLASGHQTHRGVSLVRANNECRTQYLADRDDYTEVWLDNVTYDSLADTSITAAIKSRESHFPHIKRLGHRPIDHLTETGLLRLKEDACIAGVDAFTGSAAALILLGKENRIKAEIPSAETVIAVETPITTPLTTTNSSMVTSKPAIDDHPKTGQRRERWRQGCFSLLPPDQASPFWFSSCAGRT